MHAGAIEYLIERPGTLWGALARVRRRVYVNWLSRTIKPPLHFQADHYLPAALWPWVPVAAFPWLSVSSILRRSWEGTNGFSTMLAPPLISSPNSGNWSPKP